MKQVNFITVITYLILGFLFVFVFVPNLLILFTSLMDNDPQGFAKIGAPSLNSYKSIFDPILLTVLWNSVYLALLTTFFCLFFGYAFAYSIMQFPKKYHPLFLLIVILPFWTNSLIRIYGLKIFLGKSGVLNSILLFLGVIEKPVRYLNTEVAVILGMVYLLLPFMILPIYTSLERMNGGLIEAAKDLGAPPLQRFLRIVLPLSVPGIIAGVTLVFIPSMGLFYVADVLGGTKILLIGNLIKTEFLVTRNWPIGAAISIFLVILLIIFVTFYSKVNKIFDDGSNRGGSSVF